MGNRHLHDLHGWVLLDNLLDTPLICRAILLEKVVGVGLRRGLRVRVIQQVLDSEKDLLDGDGRAPCFLFVKD